MQNAIFCDKIFCGDTIQGKGDTMSHKIIRVTKTEFETDDGKVRPMMFDLDEVPTVD